MTMTTFTAVERTELAYRAFWGLAPALSDFIRVRLDADGLPRRLTLDECVRIVGTMPAGEIAAAIDMDARLNAAA